MHRTETHARASVDLSDLISVCVNSKPLDIVLSNILSRLDKLDGEGTGRAESSKESKRDAARENADRRESEKEKGRRGRGHKEKEDAEAVDAEKEEEEPGVGEPGGPDLTDAVRKLQREMKEQQRKSKIFEKRLDEDEEAIEDLDDRLDEAEKELKQATSDIGDLKRETDRLENVKADKKDLEELQRDVADLNERLRNLADELSALKAKVGAMEGLMASANPEDAKKAGLNSFADQLADVLQQLREMQDKLRDLDGKVDSNRDAAEKDLNDIKIALKNAGIEHGDASETGACPSISDGAARDGEPQHGKTDRHADIGPDGSALPRGYGMTAAEREMLHRTRADVDELMKNADKSPSRSSPRRNKQGEAGGAGAGAGAGEPTSAISDSAAAAGVEPVDLSELQRRVAALEDDVAHLGEQLEDEEKQRKKEVAALRSTDERHEGLLDNIQKELNQLAQETSQNTAHCASLQETKADKADLGDIAALQTILREYPALEDKVAEVDKLCSNLDERASTLQQEKASKDPVRQLLKDVHELKKIVQGSSGGIGGGDEDGEGSLGGVGAMQLRELQSRLSEFELNNKSGIDGLRAAVEHLEHNKADAVLVADKAERDYVENAMEKLMREVENVLNATNAGLIDTLDKSLNILRDMIDGRATKADVSRLQNMMQNRENAASDGGAAADGGLTGYRSYRCLGCNRPMETMRPRAGPSINGNLVNRVPANVTQQPVSDIEKTLTYGETGK